MACLFQAKRCSLLCFKKNSHECKSALVRDGTRDWKNLCHLLSSHEKSHDHLDSFQRWKELEIRLVSKQTIDAQAQRVIDGETLHWQQVLQRLIALMRVMATQNIALRGTTDRLNEPNNRNFLKFVEMLGIFDGIMKEHVRRVQSKETHVHYLGKRIQNEIIDMLAQEIQQTVCSDLKAAKYVSIILNCTPDKSKTEQMTMVVRLVSTEDETPQRHEMGEPGGGYILFKVNITSKSLQTVSFNISLAVVQLNSTRVFLQDYRSDAAFAGVLASAKELAEEVGFEPCFPVQPTVRPRKKRSLFGYEGEDEPVTDLQQKFKVHFFNQILDFAIQSFNERFTQLEEHSSIFSILYNIPTIKDMDTAALTRDCTTLERALTYRDSRDIDAKDLCNELKVLSRRLDSEAEPLNALEYITRHQMASLYPNAFVALRVLLTLPETVASGERTFSKLKLMKNYLRSTMSQERLNGLATISIEHELSYKINL
ncbi:uncharacterized protein LOC121553274 [Coregonus clupeaformis]|uniref:uncharacterized protein LOC121553274 n=1 Tax=Coregonus clupeaformis TaxID=59861 RepID=UPI001E1C2E19|nr:uncharacterized protein LOC121553274 [Coregonus clupeaformis]